MKLKFIPVLMGLALAFQQFYFAMVTSDGKGEVFLRIGLGLIWLGAAYFIIKDKTSTKEERLITWYKKNKPKGIGYHLIKWTFGWGVFFCINSFVIQEDLVVNKDKSFYGMMFAIYLITGAIFGLHTWRKWNKEVQKLGLNGN